MKSIILLLSLFLNFAKASDFALIESHDIKTYHPSEYGLKDLVFEIRIPKLTKLIKDDMAFKSVSSIYFKVYWIFPGQYSIKVEGLPKGMNGRERELRNQIRGYLDFVIPRKFYADYRSYTFKREKMEDKIVLRGVDETFKSPFSRVDFYFDSSEQILSMESFGPEGVIKTNFDYEKKAWSKNRIVLRQIVKNIIFGMSRVEETVSIDYKSIQGYGFPEKVKVASQEFVKEIKTSEKGETKAESVERKVGENEFELIFSTFEVNTKKARQYILNGN